MYVGGLSSQLGVIEAVSLFLLSILMCADLWARISLLAIRTWEY
jgi:hypothetical protein